MRGLCLLILFSSLSCGQEDVVNFGPCLIGMPEDYCSEELLIWNYDKNNKELLLKNTRLVVSEREETIFETRNTSSVISVTERFGKSFCDSIFKVECECIPCIREASIMFPDVDTVEIDLEFERYRNDELEAQYRGRILTKEVSGEIVISDTAIQHGECVTEDERAR